MEHHKADVRQVAGRGAAGDDTTRFLRELRQLRDGAGLGHAELAARAHYPYDTIKAAEVGPTLPDLPVLSAYVRGCGGTAEEWEERWRRLTRTPSLPVAASRHAGNSAAATAGARIGATTQVVDSPDPSVIMAALNRVAEGMAVGGPGLDAAPLTVPPRPAYPADDAPADSSPAGMTVGDVSFADLSLGNGSHSDAPLGDGPFDDGSMPDVSLADPFAAGPADNPVTGSADFAAFAAVTPVSPAADPLVIPAEDPLVALADALAADSTAGPAQPEADDGPKGWDPIRVSAAWPKIGDEDPRVAQVSDDAASAAAQARSGDGPSAGWSRPSTSAPAQSGAQPVIRQSAWSRGVDAAGEPTSVARPGSRARTLMVAVVLVCVIAVVLAIFA